MSEMIERVARAIEATYEQYADSTPAQRARAAILAMREPTDAMRCAGLYRGPFRPDSTENPEAPWQRMIDAALTPAATPTTPTPPQQP